MTCLTSSLVGDQRLRGAELTAPSLREKMSGKGIPDQAGPAYQNALAGKQVNGALASINGNVGKRVADGMTVRSWQL